MLDAEAESEENQICYPLKNPVAQVCTKEYYRKKMIIFRRI